MSAPAQLVEAQADRRGTLRRVLRRAAVARKRRDRRDDLRLAVGRHVRPDRARDARRLVGERAPLARPAGDRDVGVRREVHPDAERAQLAPGRQRDVAGALARVADVDLRGRREVAERAELAALLRGGDDRRRMAGVARRGLQRRRQRGELLRLAVVGVRQQDAAVRARLQALEEGRLGVRAGEADEEQPGDRVLRRAGDLVGRRRRGVRAAALAAHARAEQRRERVHERAAGAAAALAAEARAGLDGRRLVAAAQEHAARSRRRARARRPPPRTASRLTSTTHYPPDPSCPEQSS